MVFDGEEVSIYSYLEKRVFGALQSYEASNFTKKLRTVLFYMCYRGLITHRTVAYIDKALGLKQGWSFLQVNPDNTYSCYINRKIAGVFFPDELGAWILLSILEDKIFSKLNSSGDFNGMKEILSETTIPLFWGIACESINEIEIPIFTSNYIFWTKSQINGALQLFKMPIGVAEDVLVGMDKKEEVFSGLTGEIIYSQKKQCIYGTILGMDAYIKHNIRTGNTEYVYQRKLLGVSDAGVEWFQDREGIIRNTHDNKVGVKVLSGYDIQCSFEGEVLKVEPTCYSIPYFRPFIIKSNGEMETYRNKNLAKFLWNTLVSDIKERTKRDDGEYISSTIEEKALRNTPHPFCVSKIRKRIEEMEVANKIELNEGAYLKGILDRLLKWGVKEDDDVTECMYELIKCQRLCMKSPCLKNLFGKRFFGMIKKVTEERAENLPECLSAHSEQLFRDWIYWTENKLSNKKVVKNLRIASLKRCCGEWGLIGSFSVQDNHIDWDLAYLSDGIISADDCGGEFITMANPKYDEGTIAFDRVKGQFLLFWDGKFTYWEELENKLKGQIMYRKNSNEENSFEDGVQERENTLLKIAQRIAVLEVLDDEEDEAE